MASKKDRRREIQEEDKSAADYYKLNTRAVDELVSASKENAPKVSKQELRKYQSGPRVKLAEWVKAVLLKAWFSGMVCFFFLWGLGTYVSDQLDMLVIVGLALGFVKDLLENPIFRFYAKTPGGNDRWMMFPQKRYISLPLNVLYAFLLLFCVVTTYNGINGLLLMGDTARDKIPLGVEPILFGLFAMGWDMLFIGAKRLFKRILADAKNSARPS